MTTSDKCSKLRFDRQPGYPMSFHPAGKRVRVMFAGTAVADSTRAMVMDEDDHRPVYYFAQDDVRMDLMSGTAHSSH